jgi:ribonucleoside-diphosphate reductase alpha chain
VFSTETYICVLCGETKELSGPRPDKLCDGCWELKHRIEDRPDLALKVLGTAVIAQKSKRPKVTLGSSTRVATGCGSAYITCNTADSKPFEVFGSLGKAGECAKCQSEAVTRLATLCLRYGGKPEEIVKQIKGIKCPSPALDEEFQKIESCPDAIAKVMEKQWVKKEDK